MRQILIHILSEKSGEEGALCLSVGPDFPVLPDGLVEGENGGVRLIVVGVEEIAAFPVPAEPPLEEGMAFFRLVLDVLGFVLEQFLLAVGELALGVVPAVAVLQEVHAELVLEFGVGGRGLLGFVLAFAGGLGEEGGVVGGETQRYHHYGN